MPTGRTTRRQVRLAILAVEVDASSATVNREPRPLAQLVLDRQHRAAEHPVASRIAAGPLDTPVALFPLEDGG